MYEQTMNNDVTLTGGENPLLAGRYQVVRQLGTGGMGSVWLAEDRQLDNKLFAVKMLPSILVANKRAYRQLKDEALVAMKLVHPNIVQIRAFEENNGNPFLVMDYIEGQTLDDYLAEKGTLSEEDTVKLLKPIAAALDYAHGEGVVHRDVKPSNMMIRKDGRPFVLDFGIAREIQETMTRVTGKSSSGTLMYMSPEQLNGELPKKEQDIYSFAAMVYECLKGEPPFVRGQIEYQIVNNPPPPLPQGTASWLSATTMRGLAKKANERPTTCCEILGVLSCGMIVADDIKLQTQVAIKAYRDEDYEKAFAAAQKADKEDAEIQYIMGRCYEFGDGVEEDHDVAMLWYRKAAVQGHLEALLEIGWLYKDKIGDPYSEWQEKEGEELKTAFNMALKSADARVRSVFADLYVCCNYGRGQGHGLEEQLKVDEVTALELIKESANGGYAEAQYQLGWRYEDGHSISQDYGEAVKWYRKAAEQGNQLAQEKLGEMYKKGLGVENDYDEAIKWYRKAAERGGAKAQCTLGGMYKNGIGVVQDYREAMAWFLKAAEQHNDEACYELGCMYQKGVGVEQDYVKAMEWYKKASSHHAAEYNLGLMYENGYGIPSDYEEARKHYTFAALYGNADAAFCCGRFYYHGLGVVQDYAKAVDWFQKADTKGSRDARYYLGLMYYNGEGVEQNDVEAVKWFLKAAEQGDAEAQYALGILCQSGRGVAKDEAEAVKWYRKAAEQGYEDAVESLKKLAGGVQLDNVSKPDGNRHETCETCAIALPGGAKMEMIYVAPGSFMMGSPGDESGRFGNEIQHHVTITKGFWLGKYPVTQEEWGSVMGENPAKFKNKRSPVENVSWNDCKEFCQRLNTRLHCGARLPTEAEWEYACRAGSIGGYGVNGSIDEISWHRDNSNNKTHPVGQKGTNAWGFMDMHGNVWEWCEDWYGDYSGATQFDPKGPESGDKRVARGGSWFDPLYCGRSAMRSGYSPRVRDPAMGFRLCCTTE